MPYATNNGVRIHYHIEGEGSPLVLMHGFTGSIEDWYEADYVEPLKQGYKLILIDSRGHGYSDKPHTSEAYAPNHRASDVTAVLDALSLRKAHFLGYSMGGFIGFALIGYSPQRFHSFILGGQQPYSRTQEPMRVMVAGGPEAIIKQLDAEMPISDAWKARLRNADMEAFSAAAASDRPDLSHVLSKITMPCLLYVGDSDSRHEQTQKFAELIPNATFVSLPGINHLQGYLRSDLILPRIEKFLAEVSKSLGFVAD